MRYFTIVFLLIISNNITGQSLKIGSLISNFNQNCIIEGVVLDAENGYEPLFYAEVTVKELNKTVSTEIDGSFKLNLRPGKYTFVYSFIGYETVQKLNVEVKSNESLKLKQVLKASKMETPNLEIAALFE